jgi:uncharacterized repeat protein (TIGR01451 family)
VSKTGNGGGIAITPDGSKLLATDLTSNIFIFSAPFSSISLPQIVSTVSITSPGLDGIMVSPDGSRAIICGSSLPKIYSFGTPFSNPDTLGEFLLPSTITLYPNKGFEDVGISADGSIAIITGASPAGTISFPAVFIQAPFDPFNAQITAVNIPNEGSGGRGSGSVRFLPPGLAPGLTIAGTSSISRNTITYTLRYMNTGLTTISNATIAFPLSEGTTLVSATGGGTLTGNTVVWNLGTLAANAAGSVKLIVRINGTAPVSPVIYTIGGDGAPLVSGTPDTSQIYYFPHLAINGQWRTTLTYLNTSNQSISCATHFYSELGTPLSVDFQDVSGTSRTDVIPANGTLHIQTNANPAASVETGWVQCECSAPVKASMLFRSYHFPPDSDIPAAEASILPSRNGATRFVTFAEQWTAVALVNPFLDRANVVIGIKNADGSFLKSKNVQLEPGSHAAYNLNDLLGLDGFSGSMLITSDKPILSFSLNAEAVPVFSALPPGED